MKTELTIKKGYVFNQTRKAFIEGHDVIIHKGGTGSGKTYEIMIFLIFYVALRIKNKVITVVSESGPHLDIGPIRIMRELLIRNNIWSDDEYNKTKAIYTFRTGSIIEFFSADRIGKALGARRYMLYGNELNHIKMDIWEELARRSRYVIGDYNPTEQFGLEDWLVYYTKAKIIISNYKMNYFLPRHEVERITRRAEMDPNFRRVHIDCEYGHSEGLVLTNWDIVPAWPEEAGRICYGLDFGFSADPTAMVRVGIKDGELYVQELLYLTEQTNKDLIDSFRWIVNRLDNIWADAAEPKSIEEIRRAGYNIRPATKGPDSIRAGIDYLKQHKIHVTEGSINLIKELRNYTWLADKAGRSINKPVDNWNHAIDAMRYAVVNQYMNKGKKVISIS